LTHSFLLKPSIWLGTGTIQLGTAPNKLALHTRWTVTSKQIKQEVEITGITEQITNLYTISNLTPSSFTISLTSATVKNILGEGVISDNALHWAFNHKELTGFENFDLQPDGSYLFQAEFGTIGEFCNQVEGKIWQSGH
jgi:hypothetical protein